MTEEHTKELARLIVRFALYYMEYRGHASRAPYEDLQLFLRELEKTTAKRGPKKKALPND